MSGALVSVNIARPDQVLTGPWTGSKQRTGIGKLPVDGPVHTGHHHLAGDSICDLANHGGPDQAVYAYSREDAQWWADELDRDLPPGIFGENLSTEGMDLSQAVIGEFWSIGSAVLEVSCPRIPCRVFAGFWDVPDLIKRFTVEGRPGAYLRIHQAGALQAGDEVRIGHRPEHGVTIRETFRALTGDRSLAHRLLEAPELPAEAHQRARVWLAGSPAG